MHNKVLILFANNLLDLYPLSSKTKATDLALDQLVKGEYRIAGEFYTDLHGEEAAEEAFDITNNPDRLQEREPILGRQRSLSVGDLVHTNGRFYLVQPTGWAII